MKSAAPYRTRRPLRTPDALKDEVRRWAAVIGVIPTQIRIQNMKTKWASCSPKGWISLNRDLLKERAKLQEQVIVHELIHLKVPNHGKLFRRLLSSYLLER
jgi:predicted metal-dependent hydrolase